MNILWGMKKFWTFFGIITKLGFFFFFFFWGGGGHFCTSKSYKIGMFLGGGLLNFKYIFGKACLFFLLNSRCLVQAYLSKKILNSSGTRY